MTIADCNIYNNCATNGAGLYIHGSNDFEVMDCIFWDNYASSNGGGAYCNDANTADVISFSNCFFIENEAVSKGGGLCCGHGSVSARNCVFYGNEADRGGGVTNIYESYGWFINCTFAENAADTYGSSMYNDIYDDGWVRVVNSIMYNNTSPGTNNKRHIYNIIGSMATVAYSDVQGSTDSSGNWNGYAGVDAGGNVDCDPEFMMYNIANYDFYGNDGVLWTMDDGLVPIDLCEVMDSADGYNASYHDIAGTKRKDEDYKTNTGTGSCSYTDMGAYEAIYYFFHDPNIVMMCFIDEADGPYSDNSSGEQNYSDDMDAYEDILTDNPNYEIASGCFVPGHPVYDVIPGTELPDNIYISSFPREKPRPTLFDFKRAFISICGYGDPDYIYIFVDNSTSMYTSTLGEHFPEFISWLESEEGYPDAILINDAGYLEESNERWVEWINDGLEDIFN